MTIKKVGVIGTGTMGFGITQLCAEYGFDVLAVDIDKSCLDNAIKLITKALDRKVERGKITAEDRNAVLSRIKTSTNLDDMKDRDLVIEVIVERMDEKKKLFAELDSICKPDTIFTTNTSSLLVTPMAQATGRPDKVMGTHFTGPIPIGILLELVKTELCSQETIGRVETFAKGIGREVIFTPDIPGFIANRLFIGYAAEALRLYEAGQATAEDLEKCARIAMGMPVGPLRIIDAIGLDTFLSVSQSFYEQTQNNHFKPTQQLKDMVAAGKLGRKSGAGFYNY